jgi:elongation factor Ts
LGKIGVLIVLRSEKGGEHLEALGNQLAMHVAASKPVALTQERLDSTLVTREKEVLTEQMKSAGIAAENFDKVLAGKMRKFYSEACLMDQPFIMEPKKTIATVLNEASKAHGSPIEIVSFVFEGIGI